MENKIDRIINIIRSLKEEDMVMVLLNAVGNGGKIAGLLQWKQVMINPPVKKKNKYIYGAGFRKNWLQRRTPQP
jgi:hypothetical protein